MNYNPKKSALARKIPEQHKTDKMDQAATDSYLAASHAINQQLTVEQAIQDKTEMVMAQMEALHELLEGKTKPKNKSSEG